MSEVKKAVVPSIPPPPNQPNNFWAPCATNTYPSTPRMISAAASTAVQFECNAPKRLPTFFMTFLLT